MIEHAGQGWLGAGGSGRLGGSRRLLQLLAAAALAVGAIGAGTQTTQAYGTPLPCAARTQSAVFAPWGDSNTYFRLSNGGFESGAASWSLSGGAAVVSGNEPYYVGGSADSHSLRIPPGGSAESRTMCVSVNQDVARLFVNNQHVSGAILHVDAIAQNPWTGNTATASFDVNGDVPSSPWSPTMQLKIPNMFGGNGTENLALRFTLRGTAATWYIDDVYVDPFKSW
jgi:hypothetical protein